MVDARAIFSPTTEPIEPPNEIKNRMQQTTISNPIHLPNWQSYGIIQFWFFRIWPLSSIVMFGICEFQRIT